MSQPTTSSLATTAPPPEVKSPPGAGPGACTVATEVVLRLLLFLSAVTAVVVMVTSKQARDFVLPFFPLDVSLPDAKFSRSPAYVYFVVALSVAGFYFLITTILSVFILLGPPRVIPFLVIMDVLLLGIVSVATGVAGAVAYLGLKGNRDVGWREECDTYDEFCRHVGAAVFISLSAAVLLAFLILLSILSLSRQIPR